MTPTQCLRARELLAWTRVDLAREAGCSSETIKNFEEQRRATSISVLTGLRRAMETAGVEFIDPSGSGPEVRLATAKQGKSGITPGGIITAGSNPPVDEDAT